MSAKNRRKKLRTINVNNQEYKWLTSNVDICNEYNKPILKIWKNNITIYNDIRNESQITPALVKDIILEISE